MICEGSDGLPVIDGRSARLTLVSALAWRAITEITRRHGWNHELRIQQIHPGVSVRGQLRARWIPKNGGSARNLILNLGGPSGIWEAVVDDRLVSGSLFPLLGNEPKQLIDEMELGLGWPSHEGPLPSSSNTVLALRALTGLLEDAVFRPVPYRISLGLMGWMEDSTCDWSELFIPGITRKHRLTESDIIKLNNLALFHCAPTEDVLLEQAHLKHPGMAFDLSNGRQFIVHHDKACEMPTVVEHYQQSLRNMESMVRTFASMLMT